MSAATTPHLDLTAPQVVRKISQRSLVIGVVFSVIAVVLALKQPDEFMTAAFTVEDFVEHHLNKVITGAIAVLVLAAALFLIYQHVMSVRKEAAEQLYEAFSALNSKDFKGAEQEVAADLQAGSVGQTGPVGPVAGHGVVDVRHR